MIHRRALALAVLLGLLAVSGASYAADAPKTASGKKKIVLVAGGRSHAYGQHAFKAGMILLQKRLNEAFPDSVVTELYTDGWPKDSSVLDSADAIVIYCDGGAGHPVNKHLDQIDRLAKKGVGIAMMHYGVETTKGASGDRFLDWIGGYFEMNWSVNPHWKIKDAVLAKDHPIARGVKPYSTQDEWYYHMRFRTDGDGVTYVLSALPPADTLKRPDGPHSGNPAVREAVARGEKQTVAWARQRPDGGRGFGFTGGHFHWTWANDQNRKMVLNAIAWIAKVEVPANGVASSRPTLAELRENQDWPVPEKFDFSRIEKEINDQ
ncbi:MAG: ThuA domain-containing protein [Planctomycetota bacterium]|jgi:type 1 glutamine amidotransferase